MCSVTAVVAIEEMVLAHIKLLAQDAGDTSSQVNKRREEQVLSVDDGTKDYLLVFRRVHSRKNSDDVIHSDIVRFGGRCKTKVEAVSKAESKMNELEGPYIASGNVLLTDNRNAPPDNGILFREEDGKGGFYEVLISSMSKEAEEELPIRLSQQITTEEGVKKRFAQVAEAAEIRNVLYMVKYRMGTTSPVGVTFDLEEDVGLFTTMGAAINIGTAFFFFHVKNRKHRFEDNRITPQINGMLLRAESDHVHEVSISTKPANSRFVPSDVTEGSHPTSLPPRKHVFDEDMSVVVKVKVRVRNVYEMNQSPICRPCHRAQRVPSSAIFGECFYLLCRRGLSAVRPVSCVMRSRFAPKSLRSTMPALFFE